MKSLGLSRLFVALVILCLPEVAPGNTGGPFETTATLNASDLLPPHLLAGDVFTVDPVVTNDGDTNHYVVRSPLGDRQARGREELERVIQELRALALLRETPKRTGAAVGFNQGVKAVAAAPYNKVRRVVFNPLYAVEAVPGEIADYAGRIATVGDLFKYGPRVFIRRSLGIDGSREGLARRLGVEPNSENEALRAEINRVAWGVWMGGLAPRIGEGYIDLEYDLSTEIGDLGDGNLGRAVDAVRREVFPRTARRVLRRIDVPKEAIQAFREHPHFTGRMRERVADALAAMNDTEARDAFIAWANGIDDPEEARRAVRLAEVLALHHTTREPLARIAQVEDQLYIDLTGNEAVLPLVEDHLLWTEGVADRVERAGALHRESAPDKALSVWSMGQVSPRMEERLAARGHGLRVEIGKDYGRFERPRKGLKALEDRYEKRVESPVRERLRGSRAQRLTLEPLATEAPRGARVQAPGS